MSTCFENSLALYQNSGKALEQQFAFNEIQGADNRYNDDSDTSGNNKPIESLLHELAKLRTNTQNYLETAEPFTSKQVKVLSLTKEKIIIEIKLKDDTADLHLSTDNSEQLDSIDSMERGDELPTRRPRSRSFSESRENSDPNQNANRMYVHNTPSSEDCLSDTVDQVKERPIPGKIYRDRRYLSESCDECPRRGILKNTRNLRRTLSESNADCYEEDDDENTCPDSSSGDSSGEDKPKKSVHFNDRIQTLTFRNGSSIVGRKKKNQRRTLRRLHSTNSQSSSSIDEAGDDGKNIDVKAKKENDQEDLITQVALVTKGNES